MSKDRRRTPEGSEGVPSEDSVWMATRVDRPGIVAGMGFESTVRGVLGQVGRGKSGKYEVREVNPKRRR